MKNERNFGTELLRILLSFGVVCTHFGYPFVLCSVHVPAYCLFYNEKMISNVDRDKIICIMKRLLIPYFWWAIIYLEFEKVFFQNPDVNLTDLFFQLLVGRGLNLNGAMWFHFTLMVLTLFLVAIFKAFKQKRAFLLLPFLAVGALVLQYTNINWLAFSELRSELMYSLGRLCEMLPYAVIGMMISGLNIFSFIETKNMKNVTWITLLIPFIWMIKRGGIFITPNGYDYQGINRIIMAVVTVVLFYFIPIEKLPALVCNVIKFVSKYSMGIYCCHLIIGRHFVQFLDNKSWEGGGKGVLCLTLCVYG